MNRITPCKGISLPRMTVLSLAVSLAAPVVVAQPRAEGTRAALEEIVVTAQRREESLQDTPISIQAFGSMELRNKGIFDLVDMHTHVPNFQIAPHPTSAATVRTFMRGVGNNDDQITQDPSVAVYLDGAYVARSQGLAMEVAEIERVEVLRGPQGTLYGRNATGGAINFITRAPDLDAFGFSQEVSVGSLSLRRSNTRVNVPIVQNQLAARFSYLTSSQDGFIRNLGLGSSHYGNRDRDAMRLDLLWQPLDDVQVRYGYDRSDIADSPALLARVDPLRGPDRPSRGSIHEDLRDDDITAMGHALTVTWQINDLMELKSVTTYRELESDVRRNFMTDTTFPTVPVLTTLGDLEQDQFSQEFQVTGSSRDGSLDYVAGVYYFEESADSISFTGFGGPPFQSASLTTADNEAWAVFGQATYTPGILDHRLHLTLGGRWSRDEREATLQQGAVSGNTLVLGPRVRGSQNYTNFSPTAIVAFDLQEDVNLYAKVARGYKSGGFNTRASGPERFAEGFDEEELTSYEIGVKSQFLDNRVRFNAAAFHADYKDIQVNTSSDPLDPTITDVINAGEARIRGVEMELTALLTDELTLNLNYGYLDPKFKELIGADGIDRKDEVTPVNSPKHSYTVDLEYRFPRAGVGVFTANLGYTWQDDMNTSSSNPDFVIRDYGLLNARLTLSEIPVAQGDLRLSVWGKNLTDEEYWVSHARVVDAYAIYGEPRTYGIDLSWEF